MEVQGSVAFVSSANRGIGKAYVEALLQAGARRIYAAARTMETLNEVVAIAPDRVIPSKDAFGIPNKGQKYWLRHLFILAIDDEGKITKMTAFWDSADWYQHRIEQDRKPIWLR
jgi:NAD(P)-dependent dehydrogenase (short-subunit alcohol dehydrogenase family)